MPAVASRGSTDQSSASMNSTFFMDLEQDTFLSAVVGVKTAVKSCFWPAAGDG